MRFLPKCTQALWYCLLISIITLRLSTVYFLLSLLQCVISFFPLNFLLWLILLGKFPFPLSFVSVPPSFSMTYSVFLSSVFFPPHLYWRDKTLSEVMDGKSHRWVMCDDRNTNTQFSINLAKWLRILWVVKYASSFIRIWGCKRQNHSLTAQKTYTTGTHYILHSWMNPCSAHWRLGFILRWFNTSDCTVSSISHILLLMKFSH